jgi:hypothetical protein
MDRPRVFVPLRFLSLCLFVLLTSFTGMDGKVTVDRLIFFSSERKYIRVVWIVRKKNQPNVTMNSVNFSYSMTNIQAMSKDKVTFCTDKLQQLPRVVDFDNEVTFHLLL